LKELPAESRDWKQLWIDKCISWRSLVGDGFSKATGGVGVGFSKATGVDSLVLTLVECIVMSEMEVSVLSCQKWKTLLGDGISCVE